MSVLSRSFVRCTWSSLPRFPQAATTLKPTRCASDSFIISCTSVNVPTLSPVPSAAFVVSGGTLLSQNVHRLIHACGDGVKEQPAEVFVKLVSLLSDVLKTRVNMEPERTALLASLLKTICSLDVLPPHPDLIEVLSRPDICSEINAVGPKVLRMLVAKVWLGVPDATSVDYLHMAANLLPETQGRLPMEIINIINDPGFVDVVRQLSELDGTVIKTNIALLVAMGRIPRASVNTAVIAVIMNNLSGQLMQVPPPSDGKTAMQLVQVSKAVTHLGFFDEEFMLAYAVKMLEIARSLGGKKVFNPFESLSTIAHVMYSLSRASIPCLALVEELEERVTPAIYRTVAPDVLLHLLWSYLAQGLQPPRAGCAYLDLHIKDIAPLVRNHGDELEQLRPYLSAASREIVAELLREHRPIASTIFHDVVQRHPELEAGVASDDAGTVHLCALVNPVHGEFIPWSRANVEPDVMSAEFAAALPGVPVAVVACCQRDTYAPRGRISGPVYRKLLMLESLGWHVLVVDMTQHWSSRKSGVLALVARIRSFGKSMRSV